MSITGHQPLLLAEAVYSAGDLNEGAAADFYQSRCFKRKM